MSSQSLQEHQKLAIRLERKWASQLPLRPEKVHISGCDSSAMRAQLTHDGRHIIVMLQDGTLQVWKTDEYHPCGIEHGFRDLLREVNFNDGINMSVSVSNDKETLVTTTTFYSWESQFTTIFMVYSVAVNDSQTRLRVPPESRTHERYEGSPVVTGNRWAFAWWQDGRRRISVGNLADVPDKKREVIMDLGSFKYQATITILSDKQILLSCRSGILLYDIPPLRSGPDRAKAVPVQPVWTHTFDKLDEYVYPVTSPPTLAPGGRIAILSGFNLRVFQPSEGYLSRGEYRVSEYPLQTRDPARAHARLCISSKRAFFCKDGHLQTCFVPLKGKGDDDVSRETIRTKLLEIKEAKIDGKLRVQDISWSETSGQLCILVGEHYRAGGKSPRPPLRMVTVQF